MRDLNYGLILFMLLFPPLWPFLFLYVLYKALSDDAKITRGGVDHKELNSKKHGCKCYLEELNESEREVSNILSRELSYKDYYLFNNIILPHKSNISTQVDHIVVSKFGIFVLETKDYKGWIFGNEKDEKWTQSLPGGNKFYFQNPIHQNFAHTMAIKELLPFATDSIISIVVFSNRSEFKTESIRNVVYTDQLIDLIGKHKEKKLNEEQVQLVIGKLAYACQTLDISAQEHIDNLHNAR